eukprot:NODE_8295_length_1507_cov_2.840580.p2 GENE.NODE_8295_length_1507_cov_2.840580~~NODE_8295_length_1507_cov_2.840580.p2  ORF type:complete len:150 (+),score=26.07 NODE_8295_length_1507_cov_2.840580:962-1411(+)
MLAGAKVMANIGGVALVSIGPEEFHSADDARYDVSEARKGSGMRSVLQWSRPGDQMLHLWCRRRWPASSRASVIVVRFVANQDAAPANLTSSGRPTRVKAPASGLKGLIACSRPATNMICMGCEFCQPPRNVGGWLQWPAFLCQAAVLQ